MDKIRHSRTKEFGAGEDSTGENCSGVKEDRRRNSSESLQPRSVFGFAWISRRNNCGSRYSPASAGHFIFSIGWQVISAVLIRVFRALALLVLCGSGNHEAARAGLGMQDAEEVLQHVRL